jgi:hypothetical protein
MECAGDALINLRMRRKPFRYAKWGYLWTASNFAKENMMFHIVTHNFI